MGVNKSKRSMLIPNSGMLVGGDGSIRYGTKKLRLTAAQIITLNTVPIVAIAAPAANMVVIVDDIFFWFKYGTVQFTGGGAITFPYHGGSVVPHAGTIAAATIQAAADALIHMQPLAASYVPVAGTGIDMIAATGNFAAGDSTLSVEFAYRIISQ